MKRSFVIILLWMVAHTAAAQFDNSIKDQADKAFNSGKYYEAAYYYKKLADGMRLTAMGEIPYEANNQPNSKSGKKPVERAYVIYRLAESYRLYQNYIEAEGWYFKLVNQTQTGGYPLARLWYGICLRANQRFDEAIRQLQLFDATFVGDKSYSAMAKHEIANCKFAIEQNQYPMLYAANKLKGQFNSDGSNYTMTGTGAYLLFTSSRSVKNDKQHLNKIYMVGKDDNAKPAPLDIVMPDGKKNNEYGTPTIDGTVRRLYFTRWFVEGTKTRHLIYLSEKSGDASGAPRPLNSNVNADGYDAIQPFVTPDGKRLFFASNKPGGQGGYDIWVSDLDNAGNATNSFNLGNTINTVADEQAPFYQPAKKHLVYSSKGFIGLGGFDLFETYEAAGKWQKPVNMGSPINSAKDDLYYFPNPSDPGKFFISSDRESDCCLDLFSVSDQRFTIAGNVFDCGTQKPLMGVRASLKDSITQNIIAVKDLGQSGYYSFKINVKRPMQLVFEKAGYFSKTVPVVNQGTDTLHKMDACLQSFVVGKPIELKNILFDFGKADIRPESYTELNKLAAIMKDNPKLRVELSAHTDSIGSDAYNLKLSQSRAQSCVDYIKSKGIDESKIFAKGYGKSRPIAPNSLPNGADNPDGRQKNRRIEFTILKLDN